MAKFLPHNVVNETKFYNRSLNSMLPTMPVPVETIQSAEVTSPTSANNSSVVVGSNPCAVPIATLSVRDLRLRGSSFIRSHASKHGLPNASRKLMKEVIELLRSHYAVVHQVTMLEDDFGDGAGGGGGGGKAKKKISPLKGHSGSTLTPSYHMKNASPTMLPQRHMSLVPFQVQMAPDQALFSQVASIVDRLPVDRRLNTMQEPMTHLLQPSPMQQQLLQQQSQPQQQQQHQQQQQQVNAVQMHNGTNSAGGGGAGVGVVSPCSARILARTRGELTSFGTSLLRPEAAAHKVHNSSRKPKHVVIDELWRHYMQCHAQELMTTSTNNESGCIGNVIDDEDDK